MKNPSTLTQKMLFVFLPFSAGYFLSYVYRSTNAILAPYLNQDLGINAEQLGLITSVYFLTFALFQLPLGILLDKFGARRVQTVLFVSCFIFSCRRIRSDFSINTFRLCTSNNRLENYLFCFIYNNLNSWLLNFHSCT